MRGPPLPPNIDALILEAADRLLARYGYRKMTIDDLADEVGIGKGSIYLRFKSKEEIVLASVDRIVARVLEGMKTIAASRVSPAEKIRRMLLFRVMHRFDRVQHYTTSLSEVLRDLRFELLERRERYFAEEALPLADVLKEGQASGAFRRQPALPTARVLLAATNSLLPFSLSARELGTRKQVETVAKNIATTMVRGLKAQASG
jgi:AcrR family transcriptional regulator